MKKDATACTSDTIMSYYILCARVLNQSAGTFYDPGNPGDRRIPLDVKIIYHHFSLSQTAEEEFFSFPSGHKIIIYYATQSFPKPNPFFFELLTSEVCNK